jgi:hypothetical protein
MALRKSSLLTPKRLVPFQLFQPNRCDDSR